MSRERSRHRAWILAGIALAAGVGMATLLGPPRVRLKDGSRILLIGDSIAQGLDPHLRALAKEAKLFYGSSFKVGSKIPHWTGEPLLAAVEAANPTVVLVALGTNDIYGKAPEPELFERARALLTLLETLTRPDCYGMGPDVFWVGPHLPDLPGNPGAPIAEALSGYRAGCDGAAEYFDSTALDLLMADHIHPTASGFAAWAGSMWKRIS